jgi:hypothetical protein
MGLADDRPARSRPESKNFIVAQTLRRLTKGCLQGMVEELQVRRIPVDNPAHVDALLYLSSVSPG